MSDEPERNETQQQPQTAAAPIIGDQLMVSDDLPIGDALAMVPFNVPARVPPDDEEDGDEDDEAGG